MDSLRSIIAVAYLVAAGCTGDVVNGRGDGGLAPDGPPGGGDAHVPCDGGACSPSTDLLRWAPPVLSDPITLSPTVGPVSYTLDAGRDYIIQMPAYPLTHASSGGPVLSLIGGRNVVIIGGEIRIDDAIASPTSVDEVQAIALFNQTGTVHIEGLWIHGNVGQGILIANQVAADHPIVQVQRTRIETMHPVGYIHTDGIQSYGGPYVLRMDEVTLQTNGVGIQVQPHNVQTLTPIGSWEWHEIDVVQNTADAYALWKNCDFWWPIEQSELFVRNLGNLAWANEDDYPVGWNRWNPGADAPITGEPWTVGLRPEGDFVTPELCGIGYVSPGYQ